MIVTGLLKIYVRTRFFVLSISQISNSLSNQIYLSLAELSFKILRTMWVKQMVLDVGIGWWRHDMAMRPEYTFMSWLLYILIPSTNRQLRHWDRDQITAISHTKPSNAFSWMKMQGFRLRVHSSTSSSWRSCDCTAIMSSLSMGSRDFATHTI